LRELQADHDRAFTRELEDFDWADVEPRRDARLQMDVRFEAEGTIGVRQDLGVDWCMGRIKPALQVSITARVSLWGVADMAAVTTSRTEQSLQCIMSSR